MGAQKEYGLRFGASADDDANARLIAEFAARHDLDEALVRELLPDARRAEAADGQRRSIQYWLAALLAATRWRRPAPGAQRTSTAQPGWYRPGAYPAVPGKHTWTDEAPPRYPALTPAAGHQLVPGKYTRSAAFVADLEAQPSPLDGIATRHAPSAAPTARLAARAHDGDGLSLEAKPGSPGLIERVFSIVTTSDAGAPLPGDLAARMKAELGGAAPETARAIAQARIHTDDAAAQAARLLGAAAFTVGPHVYFDRGAFAPGTEQGDRLLRHELTHVAQHARGELAAHGSLEVVAESSALEAEARAAEAQPARPGLASQAPHTGAGHTGSAGIERPVTTGATTERAAASANATTGAASTATAPLPSTTAASPALATPPLATAPVAAPESSVAPGPISRAPAPGAGATGATRATKGPALPIIDLLGRGIFEPPAAVAAAIDKAGAQGADIRVKLGKLTGTGVIRVKKVDGGYVTDEATPQLVPLSHPLFVAAKGVRTVLRLRIGSTAPGAITGYVTLESAPASSHALQQALGENPGLLGLRGFAMPTLAITNSLEAGTLTVGTQQTVPFKLGGWVDGQIQFGLLNSNVTFDAHASVRARGLTDGELTLTRNARGAIQGSVGLGVQLGDKFSGKATATYENGDVAVKGQIGYHSEKLHGTLGIVVADADQAERVVREQIDPSALAPTAAGKGEAPSKSGKRAIAGWGNLDFAFTDWLTGKAKVVYGPSGHITVIGKIAPPKQIDLMSRKATRIPILPQFNIEAKYGIPYLADIHVGIGVGLAATAGLGPIYMTDLAIDGIYSTDPAVLNRFSITGALRAQADAGLELTVRGYAGLTLADHSVNFGAEVIGKAGLQAYAEARPTLGYRETASPAAGKKGEYYLQGHLEMAAQPVLSLAGNLFVALDSPWWSPAGDHTWRWPIGSLEYPIPAQMGIGADVDYVIGSGKFPEVKLTKPSFDPGKFVDAMMDNHLPGKSGRDKQEQKGSFSGVPAARPTSPRPAVPAKPTPAPKLSPSAATKPGKGMQTKAQQQNVPASKQVSDKWAAGMQALGDLRKRAEKDPEDAKEIQTHLAAIKSAHGFTQLTATRQGDVWAVHAAMNPTTDAIKINAEKEGAPKDAKGQSKKNPENRYAATVLAGSTKTQYEVKGLWLQLYEHHADYPPTGSLTRHPVNSELMEVPTRPTGEYHLKKGKLSSGGAWAAGKWRKDITQKRDKKLEKLRTTNPKATETDANIATVEEYQKEYKGITTWEDLSLEIGKHSFEGHHVQPVNWGGANKESNICFLRKTEHAGFSGFFQRAKTGLLNAVYGEKP